MEAYREALTAVVRSEMLASELSKADSTQPDEAMQAVADWAGTLAGMA